MNQSLSKKKRRIKPTNGLIEAVFTTNSDVQQSKQRKLPNAERKNASILDSRTKDKFVKPLPESLQNDPILGTLQTARALNFSSVHLRRLARAGKIPAPIRIGDRKYGWRLATILKIRADREGAVRDEQWPRCFTSEVT